MKVQIPERDTPRWIGVLGVGALALALGLGIAFWGTSDERAAADEGPDSRAPLDDGERGEDQGESDDRESDDAAPDAEPGEALEGEVGALPVDAEPSPPEDALGAADLDADPEGEAEGEALEATTPDPVSERAVNEAAEAAATDDHQEPTTVSPAPTSAPPPGSLSVRRGRIAYLRCDIASGRECARDEPMEQAVWAAIDGLLACGNGPRATGQADLRLEYRPDAAPTVQWRDTFADDVARLDRDAVLGCLRTSLAATRSSLGTERLLVSFRFAVE